MSRQRKMSPICQKGGLLKLSNHLADVHQLESDERKPYLEKAKTLTLSGSSNDDGTSMSLLREIKGLILSKEQLEKPIEQWEALSW